MSPRPLRRSVAERHRPRHRAAHRPAACTWGRHSSPMPSPARMSPVEDGPVRLPTSSNGTATAGSAPAVGVARIMRHGPERGRKIFRGIGAMILGREGHGHQRRASARAIFRCIEAFATKRMRDQRLGLVILSSHAAGVEAVGDIAGRGLADEPRAALAEQFLIAVADGAGVEGLVAASDAGALRRPSGCDARQRPDCRAGGRVLPLFAARRSIPAQAFELKKNRCGIEPLSSTCDNEHTTASLGQSEELGVEDPPRDCARGSKSHTRVRPFSPWRNEGGVLAR